MRPPVTAELIERFMREMGRRARGSGRIYLTGGATAVLFGWRTSTIDVDVRLDPEPPGAFEAIARLKDELQINVELASPQDFIPPLPDWTARSRFIARHGAVSFHHYDLYAQALSKIERGHTQDLADVSHLLSAGLVDPGELQRLFESIEADLVRYPAIDADEFRRKLNEALEVHGR